LPPFKPFFRNAHLATIAGNFWSRPEGEPRWPVESIVYRTEPEVQVMVHAQRPHTSRNGSPKGELLIVHGLEGSSLSGYARSMAYAALDRGYSACRFNLRGCGGTEHLALTSYHGGQTSDVLSVIRQRREASGQPLFLAGFSLGGNIVLKLAGELGDAAPDLLSGVCSVSAPIDLAACATALERPENFLYQRRFVARLKERIRRRNRQDPELYTLKHLHKIRTIVDFDTYYTARLFGFGTAANYFSTQSSGQFLDRIRIPALLVQAQDDPLIPFSIYNHPAFASNANLRLVTSAHGGHVGFISRRRPRFWVDQLVLDWVEEISGSLTPGSLISNKSATIRVS
jgi:predicted alpha/beta-fold hydrolase